VGVSGELHNVSEYIDQTRFEARIVMEASIKLQAR